MNRFWTPQPIKTQFEPKTGSKTGFSGYEPVLVPFEDLRG